ncbi:MAG: YitT family protein [Bulleidia sp.]|nr:YitT family protein [Bulleidia sp.]
MKQKLGYVLMVIAGCAMLAFSVEAFNVNFEIAAGSTTGLSMILNHFTGIRLSLVSLIINLACLPVAWFFVGKKLAIGSALASVIYPLILAVFEEIPGISSFCNDMIVAVLANGVISGIGIGLVMRAGASFGGLDIVTVLLSRKLHASIGTVMYVSDTIIMLVQLLFIPFDQVVYGIAAGFLMTAVIDKVLDIGQEKIQITVVSQKFEEIRAALVKEDYGVTMYEIQTGLEQNRQKAVVTTFHSHSRLHAENIIQRIDPTAFITVQKIADVHGRGYTLEKIYLPVEE